MKKLQIYEDMHLCIDGMRRLDAYLTGPGGFFAAPHEKWFSLVSPDGASWEVDSFEEFLAEYRPGLAAIYTRTSSDGRLELEIMNCCDPKRVYTRVIVRGPDKVTVEAISEMFEGQPGMDFSW